MVRSKKNLIKREKSIIVCEKKKGKGEIHENSFEGKIWPIGKMAAGRLERRGMLAMPKRRGGERKKTARKGRAEIATEGKDGETWS